MPMPCVPTPGRAGKRTTEPECRNRPLDPEQVLPLRGRRWPISPAEPRGTHGRRIRRPRACLDRRAKEQMAAAFKTSNHTVSVHSAFDLPPAQRRDRDRGEGNLCPGRSGPVRDRAGAGQRHRALLQWHKIAWSIADYLRRWKRARRTFEQGCKPVIGRKVQPEPKAEANPSQRPKPSPNQRPKPRRAKG